MAQECTVLLDLTQSCLQKIKVKHAEYESGKVDPYLEGPDTSVEDEYKGIGKHISSCRDYKCRCLYRMWMSTPDFIEYLE